MTDFDIKPLTSFSQIVDGKKINFRNASDGTTLYSESGILNKTGWQVAKYEMRKVYDDVIENQKKLISLITGTKSDLSPYILSNKKFNCPYMYDKELLFYIDKNTDGQFDQDELAIEIDDYDRNGNPDHIAVFDESGKKYIELNGNDFSDLILGVLIKGLRQCADSSTEKTPPNSY